MSVAVVDRFTEIRERILASAFPFDFTGKLEEKRRLADQIESDVRQRDVFFEYRTMSAPLRKTVTENQTVVAES